MTVEDVKQLIRDDEKIKAFINEACMIHASVNQDYDDKPYGYHIRNVVNQVINGIPAMFDGKPIYYIPVVLFGAAFHDTIEDARLTYNDVLKIAKGYFDKDNDAYLATEIVYALTNEKGRNRNERASEAYYRGIRETMFAPFVKYCDRMANMQYSKKTGSRMYAQYEKEMPHFLDSIMGDDIALSLMGAEDFDFYKVPVFEPVEDVDFTATNLV